MAAIRSNIDSLGAADRTQVIARAAAALPAAQPFDLIFADPPYSAGSGSAVIAELLRAGWVAGGGWVAIETGRGDTVDPQAFSSEAERDVGRARLTLLRRASTSTLS